MAGAGWHDFVSGEVLTAANVQDYLMDQSEMVFATTTARDSAIATPTNGMTAYTTTDGILWRYNGTAWKAWGKAPTAYTPTLTNATYTSGSLYYSINAGMMTIIGNIVVSAVSGSLTFSMPSGFTIDTGAMANQVGCGVSMLIDTGVGNYAGVAQVGTSSTIILSTQNAAGTYLLRTATSSTVPFTWGAGDVFQVNVNVFLA